MRLCVDLSHYSVLLVFLGNAQWLRADPPIVVKPVTVCEVLADLAAFVKMPVAILGKFEGGSVIDGRPALIEDRCKQSVITEVRKAGRGITTGYAWENRIDLLKGGAVPSELTFGGAEFDEKLRIAGIWTTLDCFDIPVRRPDGTFFAGKRRQQWAVAYGRLNTRGASREGALHGPKGTPGTLSFLWGNGFGHLGNAPAQLVYSEIKFIGSAECGDGK